MSREGRDIISTLAKTLKGSNPETTQSLIQAAHASLLEIHTRALACHCECLGMNAENAMAVCANSVPPFNQGHYQEVMRRWGLVNEKGEPII